MSLVRQVVQRIKAMENRTRLLVVDLETHETLRSMRVTATEEMAIIGTGLYSSPSPPASPSPLPASGPSSPGKQPVNGSVSKQPVLPSSPVQKPTRRSPSKAAKKVSCPSTTAGASISSHQDDFFLKTLVGPVHPFIQFLRPLRGGVGLEPIRAVTA